MRNFVLLLIIIGTLTMAKNVKRNGNKGGKTLIPESIQGFSIDQLRGADGRTIRELREIAKNRKKPPVNRTIKPPFVMPKKGHT